MSATNLPNSFYTPARVGLNAVAVPQGRNIQAGTAILKYIFVRSFMFKKSLLLIALASFGAACGSSEPANSANNANVPPEFSGNSVPTSGEATPGIPDANAANNVPKGTTPTPGIPDPKDIGKPLPKGATPTPGIPDEATLKRQANTVITDMDLVNNPQNANKSNIPKPQNDRKGQRPPQ
ncbi:MAG: hypothetical protein KIS76_14035 [Pyrinomonadaceae bacterium]|nr:hypothetical protein [Pyrinomonadaceae bacterium]